MSRHRAEARPRYGRIAVLGSSLGVTAIAVLGGAGVLPSPAGDQAPAASVSQARDPAPTPTPSRTQTPTPTSTPDPAPLAEPSDPTEPGPGTSAPDTSLPVESGSGKRVVFSESRQRVWLMDDDEEMARTYLVSGSVYDNLEPGTFEVYSRSEDATGIQDSGAMKYFVRFTQGDTGAAIGFHDIPVDDGELVQTASQLGTPLSHGCIRQERQDAIALWDFAPIGTTVVVTA
ncbi:MAG: L,D-transpeptidase [Nocardioides sp.]